MATQGGGYVVVYIIYNTNISIVDNRLAMEKANCFRVRYETLAQHS